MSEVTEKVTRKGSTIEQKMAAVNEVRRLCLKGLPVHGEYIKRKYGVSNAINKLIQSGTVERTSADNWVLKWVSKYDNAEDIVHATWTAHGSVPNRDMNGAAPIVPSSGVIQIGKPVVVQKQPVEEPVPPVVQRPPLTHVLTTAINECEIYGITNKADYIATRLVSLGYLKP